MNKLGLFILSLTVFASACQEKAKQVRNQPAGILVDRTLDNLDAAVSCAHPEAAKIGASVLKNGGNAIDAVVAIQWALAVCYPEAGNIGGGGFMTFRRNDGLTAFLDYREIAPAMAFERMYQDRSGNVIEELSLNTRLAAGVPGTVMGIYAMHQKFGNLPMDSLINPAIRMAREGFSLTELQAENLNEAKEDFLQRNREEVAFVKNQGLWKGGDLLIQEELAQTLERIKNSGPPGFYRGETALLISDEMAEGRGMISLTDLETYEAKWRNPIEVKIDSLTIISASPPSSGGILLGQLFTLANIYRADTLDHNSPAYLHLFTEMERRVYADRAVHLGDPDFYPVPVEALLDEEYLSSRMSNFSWEKATPSDLVEAGQPLAESTETTHISVVDAEGNAVAVTTTLNGRYGSKVVVSGAGFLLNNEMNDFSSKPGKPNMFGLIGGQANAIGPKKRMLSSMTPTIVLKNDSLFLVVGSPGGSTIITTVFQILMNTAVFDMNLKEAVSAHRFHSQWQPDKLFLEDGKFNKKTISEISELGHEIDYFESLGRVDAILVSKNGELQAVGDSRGDDVAAGYRKK